MKKYIFVIGLSLMTFQALSAPTKVNAREFSLFLDKTRIIYNEESSAQSLSAINKQKYPMLLQAKVIPAHEGGDINFIVTPPISRVDPGQQVSLRIIKDNVIAQTDRETLSYLCVKGLPPEKANQGDVQEGVGLKLNVLVSACEKIIYRPKGVSGKPQDSAGQLTWRSVNGQIVVNNPTPFIMTLGQLFVNGEKVSVEDYIPPFGALSIDHQAVIGSSLDWTVIADYGGDSRKFTARLK
ncbi:fimbria/pilus periplasmic chaperone [Rosenbergiella epipactidis]|uniref:fimbria/pilus periplasmic chaperone n=1 Tax=Rosenbergiella epipactidis TaxID=1544694 RepID=UPI0030C80DD9